MQVICCLKFCNMAKSGGIIPPLQILGGTCPLRPRVIYAHMMRSRDWFSLDYTVIIISDYHMSRWLSYFTVKNHRGSHPVASSTNTWTGRFTFRCRRRTVTVTVIVRPHGAPVLLRPAEYSAAAAVHNSLAAVGTASYRYVVAWYVWSTNGLSRRSSPLSEIAFCTLRTYLLTLTHVYSPISTTIRVRVRVRV